MRRRGRIISIRLDPGEWAELRKLGIHFHTEPLKLIEGEITQFIDDCRYEIEKEKNRGKRRTATAAR